MLTFLFDIDGTLVDSSAVVERAWRQVAREFGTDGDAIVEFFPPPVRAAAQERIDTLELANRDVTAAGADRHRVRLGGGTGHAGQRRKGQDDGGT